MDLRPGRLDEASELSGLAIRSKGHWGYDTGFLESCRSELTLAAADIARRRIVVADENGVAVGFCSLEGDPPDGELGYLFVEPAWIGHGVGRLLWDDMCRRARALGFARIRVEADPGAVPFYLRMGARQNGSVPSGSIPGRRLPLLVYRITT